jgi:hypothetical protein
MISYKDCFVIKIIITYSYYPNRRNMPLCIGNRFSVWAIDDEKNNTSAQIIRLESPIYPETSGSVIIALLQPETLGENLRANKILNWGSVELPSGTFKITEIFGDKYQENI